MRIRVTIDDSVHARRSLPGTATLGHRRCSASESGRRPPRQHEHLRWLRWTPAEARLHHHPTAPPTPIANFLRSTLGYPESIPAVASTADTFNSAGAGGQAVPLVGLSGLPVSTRSAHSPGSPCTLRSRLSSGPHPQPIPSPICLSLLTRNTPPARIRVIDSEGQEPADDHPSQDRAATGGGGARRPRLQPSELVLLVPGAACLRWWVPVWVRHLQHRLGAALHPLSPVLLRDWLPRGRGVPRGCGGSPRGRPLRSEEHTS